MKPILIVAAAAMAGSALPQFSFGPHKAGVAYTSADIAALDCKQDRAVISCTDSNANVGGTWAVVEIVIVKRRLSSLIVAGDRDSLPEVTSAMQRKYGPPCASGSETLVNGRGNAFPSPTTTWCFQTGKFVLHQTGLRMDSYKAVFVDETNPEI